MFNTLYLLNYNNYYNRLVKRESNLDGYLNYEVATCAGVNFNPNDGIITEQTINIPDDVHPDYMVVIDDDLNIVSRWFIIEMVRVRGGQYKLTLRRDVVVDYYNLIVSSPMYIEKATLTDSDPFILNSEGVSVNQIKTNEYYLQDDTRSAWIVGYIAKDATIENELNIQYSNIESDITLDEGQTIVNYLRDKSAYKKGLSQISIDFAIRDRYIYTYSDTLYWKFNTTIDSNSLTWQTTFVGKTFKKPSFVLTSAYEAGINSKYAFDYSIMEYADKLTELLNGDDFNNELLMDQTQLYFNNGTSFNIIKYREIEKLNNKILSDYTDTAHYKLSVSRNSNSYERQALTDLSNIDGTRSIKTYLENIFRLAAKHPESSADSGSFDSGSPNIMIKWVEDSIALKFEQVSYNNFTLQFPNKDQRIHLNDAPYDMFCVPYKKGGLKMTIHNTTNGTQGVYTTMDAAQSLSVVQSIVEGLGKANIYDVQLLPYCPLEGWEYDSTDGSVVKYMAFDLETNKTKEAILNFDTNFFMFFSSSSRGTINSSQVHLVSSENGSELPLPIAMPNKKIANECDMYRLVSPNYNGQFEFKASKLNGITGFNIDYTYLPYAPYIHVNPDFKSLYGKDWNDARGLICQGDFSISYLSDAWVDYQVQNKNYANIFSRGTENLELTQGIQRKQQIFSAATGSITGGVAGAMTGAAAGPWGAIAGAAVGTVASAVGGALDVQYGDILRNEAIDYRQDLFNYQLENIQALPDGLAKVSALNENNKIFPILEYYTCTEEEKHAIANKIAYNGMTVMRIDVMSNFIPNRWTYDDIESKGYIKGQLIRLEGINEDYHVVNAIAGELYKGVYI